MNTRFADLLAAAVIAFATPLAVHAAGEQGAQPSKVAGAADMAEGEVRKVDKEGGKLTLKHGEIKNLDMPGMTMVFVVRDKAALDKLQPGDKIKFKAINDSGKFTVTEIEPAK